MKQRYVNLLSLCAGLVKKVFKKKAAEHCASSAKKLYYGPSETYNTVTGEFTTDWETWRRSERQEAPPLQQCSHRI